MATESNITKFKDELTALIKEGKSLLERLELEAGEPSEERKKELSEKKLPSFHANYEQWYSTAMQVIKQMLPDRFEDFVSQYKNNKRKYIDWENYVIHDYMMGIMVPDPHEISYLLRNDSSRFVIQKFLQQLRMLEAAKKNLESSLSNITETLQADLFDDELDAATDLAKKGHFRGAGVMAGVVLEKHLGHVCKKHNLKIKRKFPAINDFNEKLKENNVIDIPAWRRIQHLADLRNLCGHDKEREPSQDEINDLISGVKKIIKTIF